MTRLALAALLLSACGGDDGGSSGTPDAGNTADANTNKVQAVTCPATVDATVTTKPSGESYDPMMTTVPVNAIVKFEMPGDHHVAPNPTSGDPGLSVGFGETKCLKFTAAGTYGFYCTPHGFSGTIVVQ